MSTNGEIDQIAKAVHEKLKDGIEFHVNLLAPQMVSDCVRQMLRGDPILRNEIIDAVRVEARELLAAFKTAAPKGPVISRAAIRDALQAVPIEEPTDAELERAVAAFTRNGYFVV